MTRRQRRQTTQVILTHEHTDFDGLASLLAASKLFVGAVPVLPRQPNRNLQHFLTLYWDALPFVPPDDLPRARVERAIMVDTQSVVTVKGMDTDTQIHGVTESIGVDEGTTANVSGLPTTEMQTRSTFTNAGWDFVDIWLINEGATYPVLRQEIRSDLNGDGVIDFVDFALYADHYLEGTDN